MENPTPKPSLRQRVYSWRTLRRIVLCLIGLITLVVLLRAEENWRGRRAWLNYKHAQEAKGDRFDRERLIPTKVPDEQNFAMTPFLAPLFDFIPGTQTVRDTNATAKIEEFAKEFLNKVETNTPAAEVMEMMRPFGPVMAELETASHRPFARFNLAYELPNFGFDVVLSHLAEMKKLCQLFRYRASAELALGQKENALRDISVMMRLVGLLKSEPFIISELVRIADVHIAMVPVQKGLETHVWSEEELQTLQTLLGQTDFITDANTALYGERDFMGNLFFERLKTVKGKIEALREIQTPEFEPKGAEQLFGHFLIYVMPHGWDDLEQLNYNRLFASVMQPINPTTQKISPTGSRNAAKTMEAEYSNHPFLHHCNYSRLLLPAFERFGQKVAIGQNVLNMAAIVCALERHHLAKGQYPDSLEALTPRYIEKLPHDVINGEPFKYHVQPDGKFLLYSVGWNENDDGGTVVTKKDSKIHTQDMEQGDWVWSKGRWSR